MRINEPVPDWVQRLLATGERPRDDGSTAYDQYFDWLFCGATIPGLPDPLSPEGRPLWQDHDAD